MERAGGFILNAQQIETLTKQAFRIDPHGLELDGQLAELGVECEVVAPALSTSQGRRLRQDGSADAEKLARCIGPGI